MDWWEGQLDDCYAGRATHPVFVALGETKDILVVEDPHLRRDGGEGVVFRRAVVITAEHAVEKRVAVGGIAQVGPVGRVEAADGLEDGQRGGEFRHLGLEIFGHGPVEVEVADQFLDDGEFVKGIGFGSDLVEAEEIALHVIDGSLDTGGRHLDNIGRGAPDQLGIEPGLVKLVCHRHLLDLHLHPLAALQLFEIPDYKVEGFAVAGLKPAVCDPDDDVSRRSFLAAQLGPESDRDKVDADHEDGGDDVQVDAGKVH